MQHWQVAWTPWGPGLGLLVSLAVPSLAILGLLPLG